MAGWPPVHLSPFCACGFDTEHWARFPQRCGQWRWAHSSLLAAASTLLLLPPQHSAPLHVSHMPPPPAGAKLDSFGQLSLRRQLAAESFPAVFRGGPVVTCSPSLNWMQPGFCTDFK